MTSTKKPWSKSKNESNDKSTSSSDGGTKSVTRTLLDIRSVKTKKGVVPKLQLAKDVDIYYQGVKVDLGEFNSAFMKSRDEIEENLSFLVEKEYITPEEADERVDFLNEKNITAQLTVKI